MSLKCDCGFVADGRDEDAIVLAARAHAREVHKIELTNDLVLAAAEEERKEGRLDVAR